MATLKGALRSYGAAVRRMEREQQRQTREAAKKFKALQKLQEIQDAEQAVSDWNNYVNTIQSVHKNCTTPIDWKQIENTNMPTQPTNERNNELAAKFKLDNFRPTISDKIFGTSRKKINKLRRNLERSQVIDKKEYDVKYEEYLNELKNWEELQKISSGIKDKDPNYFKMALEYFDPFSDIGELGTKINFSFNENFIDIDLHVNSLDIIPDYELKQTSTGKLSKKNMPKSRFNELYQDHICSASLRVAREVFAYLPVKHARLNALSQIINTKTGHLEEQPILSVMFVPTTIENLNLNSIDPSDSMQNFVHNMKFNKVKGFSMVKRVELEK